MMVFAALLTLNIQISSLPPKIENVHLTDSYYKGMANSVHTHQSDLGLH